MFENKDNIFHQIADLKACVEKDKQAKGLGMATKDRYPIRFVLFDNFRDCYEFVDYLQTDRSVQIENVDHWIDFNYPDLMITHFELSEKIHDYIKEIDSKDCVIAPFSELARFYNNKDIKTFDALLKTIKGIEASPKAIESHQRVYIPIVGLKGKMDTFAGDSQTTIWQLVSEENNLTYRLILTDGNDFGVKGLENKYTVVNNVREWLNLWKDNKSQITPDIICKSRSIFANAEYAQPDNAFSYVICNTAFQFLTDGLRLTFGGLQQLFNDGDNWLHLAEKIDLTDGFNFIKFVKNYFGVYEIENHNDFIQLWFNNPRVFDRWLLARYYMNYQHGQGYVCRVLKSTSYYGNNEFIEKVAMDLGTDSEEKKIRDYCLKFAVNQNIQLSIAVESEVAKQFDNLQRQVGYSITISYFTGISKKEKELAVYWLGQRKIGIEDVKLFYPDLYLYCSIGVGLPSVPSWVEDYFKEYKNAKAANKYTPEIKSRIALINESETAFDGWYNQFSTTYSQLTLRDDIEVYYWIDGLGIDWIPLIKEIIAERKEQHIFLNEVMVARALLPTKTDVNKQDLQRLLPEGVQLEKAGDLDALAHKSNNICPFTLIDEIALVRKTIEEILDKYIGKKIAIISDHGLSYLPQLLSGKNMGGVESDHHGRVAIRKKPDTIPDESYFRLEDNKTLCALKHESLCGKVPTNQGIHGGCTPEEVLVPIFVISNTSVETEWTAEILDFEISGANPYIRFSIKNLPLIDYPFIIYNNVKYNLHLVDPNIYKSDAIKIAGEVNTVALHIGCVDRVFNIKSNSGIKMDDPFAF
ncbi:MAG: BREX-4 system phosphatase PglZ [Prevotella sp.]|jgi:hypothetical protein|nr:BREX-4 system phosphatase PglZ [Prevotella sp.]